MVKNTFVAASFGRGTGIALVTAAVGLDERSAHCKKDREHNGWNTHVCWFSCLKSRGCCFGWELQDGAVPEGSARSLAPYIPSAFSFRENLSLREVSVLSRKERRRKTRESEKVRVVMTEKQRKKAIKDTDKGSRLKKG